MKNLALCSPGFCNDWPNASYLISPTKSSMNLVKCDDDPQFIPLSKATGMLLVKKFSTKFLLSQILSSITLKAPFGKPIESA
jgi:hypothetical protein